MPFSLCFLLNGPRPWCHPRSGTHPCSSHPLALPCLLLPAPSTSHSFPVTCQYWHRYYSFIYSGYFYSASSSPLLLRGPADTARILQWRSCTPKRHRQLRGKDLPKVPMGRLERDSNPRPFGRKATNLLTSHNASQNAL